MNAPSLVRRPFLPVALALLLAACSQEPTADDGGDTPDLSAAPDLTAAPDLAPAGAPITTAKGSWQWVDFPDAVCDDNKATGLGVRLTDSPDVLVYFMGGGGCWDNLTCLIGNTAAHGPFGAAQFDQLKGNLGGSVLDDAARNDFRSYNMIFVPYCTGDLHAGDNVAMYSRPYYHKGRANVVAYLKRLMPTFPTPRKLIVTGSSAGGYGAALNYDLFRQSFPRAQASYLIDDSGPTFVGDDTPAQLRTAFYASWGLAATVGPFCPGCKDDLSAYIPLLVQKYPSDRLALISSLQDQTIRTYMGKTPQQFETALKKVATTRLDPTANFRYFFLTGETHVQLTHPDTVKTGAVTLSAWLAQMVGTGADWKSVQP